jgi:hypothetical protein
VARRASLIAVLSEVPQLEERYRVKAANYLGGFYQQVATPAGVSRMLASCVGRPN